MVIASALSIMSKYIKAYETILVSRLITGIFLGFFTGIVPIYLNEISPLNLRGLTGTLNQLNIVLGLLVTNILGLKDIFGTEELWPVLVGMALVIALPHMCLVVGTESPKYLFMKLNDKAGAEKGKYYL